MRQILINLRKKRGLTQEQVAQKLGISRSFYGMIEVGTRNPTLKMAQKISTYFNTNIQDLFS